MSPSEQGRGPARPLRLGASVAFLAAALAAALALAAAGPEPAEAAACKGASKAAHKMKVKRAERATLCLLNKQRRSRGLPALRNQRHHKRAARQHNRLMVRANCFSHSCPGGKSLVQRLLSTAYLPCNCYWGVGENIAYGTGGRSSPRKVVRAWMKSTGHRRNILDRSFRHIGVAVKQGVPVRTASKGGTYTTDFGYRR